MPENILTINKSGTIVEYISSYFASKYGYAYVYKNGTQVASVGGVGAASTTNAINFNVEIGDVLTFSNGTRGGATTGTIYMRYND